MKYLAWFIGVLIFLVLFVYIIAFTSFGNGILKPFVESKIKEQTNFNSKLNVFSLSMSDFEIVLELNKNNTIGLKGTYSLFSQSFEADYDVKLNNLESLKPLTGIDLRNSFYTNGKAKGDTSLINVDGVSDFASSSTTYHVELTQFNPTSIIAQVQNLKLSELLETTAQKPYASANVNLDINFKNIKVHNLDGDILLSTNDGKINTKVMKDDFNISIPNTNFDMDLDARLKNDDVDYTYKLMSNLFKVSSSGKVIPSPLETYLTYALDIKELALLKPIIGADIRGSFNLKGSVEGNKENLMVKGKSDLASSDTVFEVLLKDFAPLAIKASMKNLQLSKLLYMLKQPHYTDGAFSLEADITDARMGKLKGKITTNIKDGLLDSKYLTKAYEFKTQMPKTLYQTATSTTLKDNIVDSGLLFDSTLGSLTMSDVVFNIDTKVFNSKYLAYIVDLDKLFFITGQHLKGFITAHGDIKKDTDLDVTMFSDVAGGRIEANIHNDDLKADIKSVQTLKALEMLIYPEVFKSSLNAKLAYNLIQKKGNLEGNLVDGTFTENQMLTLIKKYAKIDLYVEKFKGDIKADINKENVLMSLDLASNTSSIKTKDTKLNTETKDINSKINIIANKNPITVTLKGKATSPKVGVDVNELIKKEANKAINKKVGNLINNLF